MLQPVKCFMFAINATYYILEMSSLRNVAWVGLDS